MIPPCGITPVGSTPIDWTPIARALFVAGDRWVCEGEAAPPSLYLQVEDGEPVRDRMGHAAGGVRLPILSLPRSAPRPRPGGTVDTPEATFRAQRGGACSYLGAYSQPHSFGDREFFPDAETYLQAFSGSTGSLAEAGYLLPAAAAAMLDAATAAAGNGLAYTQAYQAATSGSG